MSSNSDLVFYGSLRNKIISAGDIFLVNSSSPKVPKWYCFLSLTKLISSLSLTKLISSQNYQLDFFYQSLSRQLLNSRTVFNTETTIFFFTSAYDELKIREKAISNAIVDFQTRLPSKRPS